jgi:hypothetical protein
MFARIGVMRALNRHVERVFDRTRRDHHWARRNLKRTDEKPSGSTSTHRPQLKRQERPVSAFRSSISRGSLLVNRSSDAGD